jgi:acyl-CoA thioesterase-1
MRNSSWSIALALLLAACGSNASDPAPTPAATAPAVPDAPSLGPVMGPERHILAFGDSLFAGYGVAQSASYPARLEAALRARGINARIANAGVSGDTSAAALERLKFTLDNQPQPPELVLLEFGGNDLLRGVAPAETKANLAAMLDALQRRQVSVLLVGMKAPPNLGAGYQQEFDAIYPALAKQFHVPLLPFLLQAVFDKPDLLQGDHIHPTAQGIEEVVAATAGDVEKALPAKAG